MALVVAIFISCSAFLVARSATALVNWRVKSYRKSAVAYSQPIDLRFDRLLDLLKQLSLRNKFVFLAGLGLVSWLLFGPSICILGVIGFVIAYFGLMKWTVAHEERVTRSAIIEWVEQLAYRQRAGVSLASSIVGSVDSAPLVLQASLRELQSDVRQGVLLAAALETWAEKIDFDFVGHVVAALSVALISGGEIYESSLRLVESLRRRVRLADEVRSLNAQARSSMYVLVALPLFFGFASSLFDARSNRFLFHSIGGLIVLVIGLCLDLLGALWMSRICGVRT
jgi:Flp pilus assembly protein TadB